MNHEPRPMTNGWQRFRHRRSGFYALCALCLLMGLTLVLELFCSHRPLLVVYNEQVFFPTYGAPVSGRSLGFNYDYEADYKDLKKRIEQRAADGFVVMPLIPWGPLELDLPKDRFPPFAPSFASQHYLGTNSRGQDVLARLLYGFRTAVWFAMAWVLVTYLIGVVAGCLMGYWGGWFDLVFQRLMEVWSQVPYIFVVMILASFLVPGFWTLLCVMCLFGFTHIAWYCRTAVMREKHKPYVLAAAALGASDWRILGCHMLPNIAGIILTFVPFSLASGILSLTALDFLGFGLPVGTPSWGQMIAQGVKLMNEAPWILLSVLSALVSVLLLVSALGEAMRTSVDPKSMCYYE